MGASDFLQWNSRITLQIPKVAPDLTSCVTTTLEWEITCKLQSAAHKDLITNQLHLAVKMVSSQILSRKKGIKTKRPEKET